MCIIISNDSFNITMANHLVKSQFILNPFKSGSEQSAASGGFEVKVTASEQQHMM